MKWSHKLLRGTLLFAWALVVLFTSGILYLRSDAFSESLRGRIISGLQQRLSTQVELGEFNFSWSNLTVHLGKLTIHGRPGKMLAGGSPGQLPPVFSADEITAEWRLLSLWPLRANFAAMQVMKPRVNVEFYDDGTSNLPELKADSQDNTLWSDQLLSLRIGRLELIDGLIRWDQRRVPLDFSAEDVDLRMKYVEDLAVSSPERTPHYDGTLSLQNGSVHRRGGKPPVQLTAEFALFKDHAQISEVNLKLAKSQVRGEVAVKDLRQLNLALKYDAHLDWQELSSLLSLGNWQGDLQWKGQGTIAAEQMKLDGELSVNTTRTGAAGWEHVAWRVRSNLAIEKTQGPAGLRAQMTNMQAEALGGKLRGSAEVGYRESSLRIASDLQADRVQFSEIASALRQLPVDLLRLPWAADFSGPIQVSYQTAPGRAAARATAEDSRGGGRENGLVITAALTAAHPDVIPPGLVPLDGMLKAKYLAGINRLEAVELALNVPAARFQASGWMQDDDSHMNLSVQASQLASIRPIAKLVSESFDSLPLQLDGTVNGNVIWTGGRHDARFKGPFDIAGVTYDQNRWDRFAGTLDFHRVEVEDSPQSPPLGLARPPKASHSRAEIVLTGASLKAGRAEAEFDATVNFADGSFRPESAFRLSGRVRQFDAAVAQRLARVSYPLRGVLDGAFNLSGTRREPRGTANLTIRDGELYSEKFDQVTAELQLQAGPVINISSFQVLKAGLLRGHARIEPSQRRFELELDGAQIPLSAWRSLSNSRVAINGVAEGHVSGQGSFDDPVWQGDWKLSNAGLGPLKDGELQGQFKVQANKLSWSLQGELLGGQIRSTGQAGLNAPRPLTAGLELKGGNIASAYSFAKGLPEGLTGGADLRGEIRGNIDDPKSIVADGSLSQLEIVHSGITFKAAQAIPVSYANQQLRFATLHMLGEQVDFKASGTISTTADPVMNLAASGMINLAALSRSDAQITMQGRAVFDAQISGTLRRPSWHGRLSVEDASAQFGRLANSLSAIRGTIVFNGNRGDLEGFRAESGGGEIQLGGNLRYSEGTGLMFNLSGNVQNVRVRYPEALSTWVDGQVNWSGSTRASLLEGRVTIKRHSIAPPNDLAQVLLTKRKATVQSTSSPFLRNLRLNLAVTSAPEVRIDTRTARNLQTAVEARIQGTAEQPAILGRIGVLSGQIEFAGKKYSINRGEVSFLNPFRFEPVLNLNVQARVQQYDITMDFTGPPDRLNVTYRSDPPLPTRDILALLVAGGARQTSLQASSQVLPQVTADSLLSQALSNQIGSRLDRIFGAGRVRVDPQLNTLGGSATATLAVEQQIRNNITLLYATNVSSAQQQYVQGEWIINPKLSVVGIRDQNGLVGVNFQITLRFQ